MSRKIICNSYSHSCKFTRRFLITLSISFYAFLMLSKQFMHNVIWSNHELFAWSWFVNRCYIVHLKSLILRFNYEVVVSFPFFQTWKSRERQDFWRFFDVSCDVWNRFRFRSFDRSITFVEFRIISFNIRNSFNQWLFTKWDMIS